MLKKEYPLLVKSAAAEEVARRTYDLCEYLVRLHKEGKLDTGFTTGAARVVSLKVARGLFRGIENAEAATVATDCPLAGLQIERKTGKKPEHPIEIVRRGYGIAPER